MNEKKLTYWNIHSIISHVDNYTERCRAAYHESINHGTNIHHDVSERDLTIFQKDLDEVIVLLQMLQKENKKNGS